MARLSKKRSVLIAVMVIALPLAACQRTDVAGGAGDSPVKAVRDFLVDGVVDHNGFEACAYMTPRLRRAATRRDGAEECRGAFDLARLHLGGKAFRTLHQVKSLAASSTVRGDHAEVWLRHGGATLRIALVKANGAEREEFQPPATEWRIAGGALPVIPVQRS